MKKRIDRKEMIKILFMAATIFATSLISSNTNEIKNWFKGEDIYENAIVKFKYERCTGFAIREDLVISARHCLKMVYGRVKNLTVAMDQDKKEVHLKLHLMQGGDVVYWKVISNYRFKSFLKPSKNLPEPEKELITKGYGGAKDYMLEQPLVFKSTINMQIDRNPVICLNLKGMILTGHSGSPVYDPSTGIVYGMVSAFANLSKVIASVTLDDDFEKIYEELKKGKR